MKEELKADGRGPEIVSIDYFLYTCFEHENTIRARPQNADVRWPLALACSKQEIPDEVRDNSLETLLDNVSRWYLERTPQLNIASSLSLENLADIVPVFMLLIKDIDAIVKAKTGDYLPSYETGTNDPVWLAVNSAFSKNFSNLEKMYLRFLHWSHASQPEQMDSEPGNRPPVGRFAPRRPRLGGGNDKRQGGNRAPRHGGERNSNDRNGNTKPRERNGNDRNGNRGGDSSRSRSDSQRERTNKGGRDRGKSREFKKDAALERESLKEVLIAVQKLNSEPSLMEYRLAPTNSYYRRLQHKQIAEEGLFSISEGDGPDRAVVVVRHEPANKPQFD